MTTLTNAYDEDLAILFGTIECSGVPCVQVKGCEFFPHLERDLSLLTKLAHHGEAREEIEGLRDMLNDCLERSARNPKAAA